MQTQYIITFIGDDRPGLVEELSATISAQGGNWLESRLSQLAGKFAGLIQISLPGSRGEELESALKGLSEHGLSVRVTATVAPAPQSQSPLCLRLTILGPDRPGIVREVAAALSAQQINVVDMHSTVSSAPMSAEALFNAQVEVEVPEEVDLEELEDTLEGIANTMDVDVVLESN